MSPVPPSDATPAPAERGVVTPGGEVRELRPRGSGPSPAPDAARADLERQVEALRADLALKDAFALRVRAELRTAEIERDALAAEVAWLRGRIAAVEDDAGRVRAEEAALRAVVAQPGFVVMQRANRALARVPALQRAVRRVSRLAAHGR